jgi:hypothetical protein
MPVIPSFVFIRSQYRHGAARVKDEVEMQLIPRKPPTVSRAIGVELHDEVLAPVPLHSTVGIMTAALLIPEGRRVRFEMDGGGH